MIAGGDVTSYASNSNGATRSPRRRSTVPFVPKSRQGVPVRASSAINRASIVAMKMRRRHGASGAPSASSHVDTPRFVKSPNVESRGA
jgi:hypothetical protein